MSVLRWAQWFCVLLVWGVGLNAVGAVALRRREQPDRALSAAADGDG